jgi:TetR/AcrR family acrAB operon transcriptional repressor
VARRRGRVISNGPFAIEGAKDAYFEAETEVKHQQRALATRELILDTAENQFFNANVMRTTLDEIAAASGLTRGAIYGHFTNKDAVIRAIFERSALPLDPFTISEFDFPNVSLSTVRQEISACMRDVLVDGRKRRLYGIAHWLSATASDGLVSRDSVRRAGEIARLRLCRALEAAVRTGEIHLDDTSESVAAYIHACLTGYFVLSLLGSPHARPDEDVSGIVAYAFASVGSRTSSVSVSRVASGEVPRDFIS